ncbi:glycosyltransferase [Pontibacter sp. E15-1]|uniref:glycosyltransferase n=1 Tax=Pontibacter sp. E15-1 TaxID=2919918 RepID=UPI001F5011C7|nr:glycosyltransferase [Pontibacter sp. E15-1]MCJ8164123.1 glycosyltransferase [Pontibacter sp. E15-1]
MKIAFFYRRLNQGGIQRMILNCAEYLTNAGHDVSVVLMRQEGEYLKLLDQKVRVIPFRSANKTDLFRSFTEILQREKFDVLFTATPPLNIFAVLCKRLSHSKTKIIISERNNTASLFKDNRLTVSKLTFLAIPLFYRFADCVVAVSRGLADNLSSTARIPRQRVRTIYNPAFTNKLLQHQADAVTHPWILKKQVPVLINVARLSIAKNHMLLIRAVEKVLETRQVKLLIVGEGPLRDVLQDEINMRGLQDHVAMVGFQLHPVSWVAKADLFVLSSDYEGFGNVVVEALATGITVVTTDCDYGPAEIINEGEFGYLAKVGDEDDLARKICYALDHPLAKEGQVGRAGEFHEDNIMQQYSALFESLLPSGSYLTAS